MKKITIRYGMYGVAIMTIVSLLSFLKFRDKPNYEVQEVIGYATIVVSLLFVYFGIRRWRDHENGGKLSFGRGLGLGSLISLFPAVAFGLLSWIEIYLDPQFLDNYYNHYIEEVKKTTPPAELQATLQKFAEEREMFSSPAAQFFVMFFTVFIIGFIITIISTLILRRDK